jgi:phosphoribosylaminoimidazole-succinocarboxamide synthase
MTTASAGHLLPLPLVRRGKVREVYHATDDLLLLVTSDRVSAFDVVLGDPIPRKGTVLTQLSAFWFSQLADVTPNHFITAGTAEIVERIPALAGFESVLAGRAMLCRRAEPLPFECVVRGYLAGSAWSEYRSHSTLAGEPLAPGLVQSAPLEPPLFSPATKATSGHDENVPFSRVERELGVDIARELRGRSLALYDAGRRYAATRGIVVADTKFEFGHGRDGSLLLIDELLTPDSSRFWPADQVRPGATPPSFDKQPLRDYLDQLRTGGVWNGAPPGPALPPQVVHATSDLTGHDLEDAP